MSTGAGGAAPGAPSPVASTSAASRWAGAPGSVEEVVAALAGLSVRSGGCPVTSIVHLVGWRRRRRGLRRLGTAHEIFAVRAAHPPMRAACLAGGVVLAAAIGIDAPA